MRIRGTLLKFDTGNLGGSWFPKDCILHISEPLPISDNFHEQIGLADIVERTDGGIIIEGDIQDARYEDLIKAGLEKGLGLGGFYNRIKDHYDENGYRVIDEASLKECGITSSPVNKDYTFEILEEANDG